MCSNCNEKNTSIYEKAKRELEGYRDTFGSIVDGWVNVVKRSPEVEHVAQVRIALCKTCPQKKKIKVFKKKVDYCSICRCPIISKTRSMREACPDEKPRWGPYLSTI